MVRPGYCAYPPYLTSKKDTSTTSKKDTSKKTSKKDTHFKNSKKDTHFTVPYFPMSSISLKRGLSPISLFPYVLYFPKTWSVPYFPTIKRGLSPISLFPPIKRGLSPISP